MRRSRAASRAGALFGIRERPLKREAVEQRHETGREVDLLCRAPVVVELDRAGDRACHHDAALGWRRRVALGRPRQQRAKHEPRQVQRERGGPGDECPGGAATRRPPATDRERDPGDPERGEVEAHEPGIEEQPPDQLSDRLRWQARGDSPGAPVPLGRVVELHDPTAVAAARYHLGGGVRCWPRMSGVGGARAPSGDGACARGSAQAAGRVAGELKSTMRLSPGPAGPDNPV